MKEKIIITIIAVFSSIAMAIAAPTLKNCASSSVDPFCTNSGCRIDFLTNSSNMAITNCEMDFDTPPQSNWWTACWNNLSGQVAVVQTNGTRVNFMPVAPSTTLSGSHIYTICAQSTSQGR